MVINLTQNMSYTLDEFQRVANHYIDQSINGSINILVSAPTGSGKTAIAEYGIKNCKIKDPKAKIIYTCPTKSLSNEKYYDMVNSWTKLNLELDTDYKIGLITGDQVINPDADILIMTVEVLYNIQKCSKKETISCVIFDEFHYINDDTRGHIWEKCIINCLTDYSATIILLSATIGNIDMVINWLNSVMPGKTFIPIVKTGRPVPLRTWIIDPWKPNPEINGVRINDTWTPYKDNILELTELNYYTVKKKWENFLNINQSLNRMCQLIQLSTEDDAELKIWFGLPAIFFVLSKKKCQLLASLVESTFVTVSESDSILSFYDYHLRGYETFEQYIEIRKLVERGICYHHSGLMPIVREVIEFLIKKKLIKIIFATETFAVGLNFPVKTVVLTSLIKPSDGGKRNLYVNEYMQMAGRAGRRHVDTVGHIIHWYQPMFVNTRYTINKYPSWNDVNIVVNGKVEGVYSKYLIDPNYVLQSIEMDKCTSNSFKFHKLNKIIQNIDDKVPISKNIKSLLDIEDKIEEFGKAGIKYVDKSFKKLLQKLTITEKTEYELLKEKRKPKDKNEYEKIIDYRNYIIAFLQTHEFVKYEIVENIYVLTEKGKLSKEMTEINPIIFIMDMEYILSDVLKIIPILSMFIDDGKNCKDIIMCHQIEYFSQKIINKTGIYYPYMDCPKWKFYPNNYNLMNDWINSEEVLTIDHVSKKYGMDSGTIIKILVKMYQITEELISNLNKINKADIAEILNQKKILIIREPVKLESMYTQLKI